MAGDERRVSITLEVEVGVAGVHGWLRTPGRPPRRFESWLELTAALDRTLESARLPPGEGP